MHEAGLSFDPWRNYSLEETRILRLNVILVLTVQMELCTLQKHHLFYCWLVLEKKKSECKLYRLQKNILKITQCCYLKNVSKACGVDIAQGNQKLWW